MMTKCRPAFIAGMMFCFLLVGFIRAPIASTLTSTSAAPFVWQQEAENGDIVSPMTTGEDAAASACRYVYAPAASSGGAVTFTFNTPARGSYHLWTRAMGLSWGGNSFFMMMDGGPEIVYEIPPFGGQWTWGWDWAYAFTIDAGSHTIRFRTREANARLDVVLLTNDPSFMSAGIAPCLPTPTATPT